MNNSVGCKVSYTMYLRASSVDIAWRETALLHVIATKRCGNDQSLFEVGGGTRIVTRDKNANSVKIRTHTIKNVADLRRFPPNIVSYWL